MTIWQLLFLLVAVFSFNGGTEMTFMNRWSLYSSTCWNRRDLITAHYCKTKLHIWYLRITKMRYCILQEESVSEKLKGTNRILKFQYQKHQKQKVCFSSPLQYILQIYLISDGDILKVRISKAEMYDQWFVYMWRKSTSSWTK